MIELFDTHCHIQSIGMSSGEASTRSLWAKSNLTSVDEVLKNAAAANVSRLMVVGCDVADSVLAADVAAAHENVYASIGIHPHEAKQYIDDKGEQHRFAALAARSEVLAVGECGLDYFYGHSPKEDQFQMLEFQLDLARQHNLPVIFHVREAFDDFWPIFNNFRGLRGVLHSYTDNQANLERALSEGLYIGVNGIATFAKQPEQLSMYKAIPLESLVLETDAPFLTPVPFRGTICEPKHIAQTAAFLAALRSESLDTLAEVTTQNARKLFNL